MKSDDKSKAIACYLAPHTVVSAGFDEFTQQYILTISTVNDNEPKVINLWVDESKIRELGHKLLSLVDSTDNDFVTRDELTRALESGLKSVADAVEIDTIVNYDGRWRVTHG